MVEITEKQIKETIIRYLQNGEILLDFWFDSEMDEYRTITKTESNRLYLTSWDNIAECVCCMEIDKNLVNVINKRWEGN